MSFNTYYIFFLYNLIHIIFIILRWRDYETMKIFSSSLRTRLHRKDPPYNNKNIYSWNRNISQSPSQYNYRTCCHNNIDRRYRALYSIVYILLIGFCFIDTADYTIHTEWFTNHDAHFSFIIYLFKFWFVDILNVQLGFQILRIIF
jgi:hypothetical protein